MPRTVNIPIQVRHIEGFDAEAKVCAHESLEYNGYGRTPEEAKSNTIFALRTQIRTDERLAEILEKIGPENSWHSLSGWDLNMEEVSFNIGTPVTIKVPVQSNYIAGEPEADVLGAGGYKNTVDGGLYPGPQDADVHVIFELQQSITTRSQLNKFLKSLPPQPWAATPGYELAIEEVTVYVEEDQTSDEVLKRD
jgi:hypothetical protein